MISSLLTFIAFLLFPALIIYLCSTFPVLQRLGIAIICYLVGVAVGNSGLLPSGFGDIQATIQDVSVALALPMLLFSLDVKKWLKRADTGLFSMLLAVIAIAVTTFILQLATHTHYADSWKLSGMAAAVYTGGTPNLAAMKAALHVDNNTYILFNTYDTVFSLLYILFMSTVARFFFQKMFRLRPFSADSQAAYSENASDISDESVATYKKLLHGKHAFKLLAVLFIAGFILAISWGVTRFIPEDHVTEVTILLITSFGIIGSFITPLRQVKYTFHLGMYIIYLFCFTVATMTDLRVLEQLNGVILSYVVVSIFGSMLIHALLCKLFHIDSDTMIITSVSAICSPPFVPGVVSGLKNKAVLITGLVTGIIGYAIGNYLGIALALLYQTIF
ncbi:hypothetical protein A374_17079 [Fictibacillus macauensis ZFHKF-1]|uniref:Integral inner membrane protein n=1 Tax=Fictibacillus macauensis ZFHKF-1 TaxID=1196324 RepID=I8AFH8_9BACL|nr:DUF819 family protein [Fictibacillus macauensis]EIT84114.1 hypothetical protein A374_17079 [Fictibacillus macauensis ZFHKF-1]